jgi:hypothetical protein
MLASSWRNFPLMTVAKEPVTGESTKETVKTIAQETSGDPGRTCGDYARVLFTFAREAAGAASARRFLRPLSMRDKRSCKTRVHRAARMRRHVSIPLYEN